MTFFEIICETFIERYVSDESGKKKKKPETRWIR